MTCHPYTRPPRSRRVSTLEAAAALLHCLEGSQEMREGLLHNLKLKVDAAFAQKGLPAVYGTR